MSVGSEQARRVCVQVHCWGRCQQEAVPIDTAQAHMTQLGPIVNGRQRQQALRQLARTCLQIHVQVCLSTGVNVGKRCARSPGYSCKSTSRAGCRPEAALVGCDELALVCVQVHSRGRLSTGCNASRHCASSPDTAGADCQQEATPVGTVPACPSMCAYTCPGLLVDAMQHR